MQNLIALVFFYVLDATHLAKERARADAEFYKAKKEAEANSVGLFSSYFLEMFSLFRYIYKERKLLNCESILEVFKVAL